MQSIEITDIILKSFTSGYLPEIGKFNLNSDSSPCGFRMLKPFHQFLFKLVQFSNNLEACSQIFFICKFSSDRLAFLIRFNRPVINASNNIIKKDTRFPKVSYKRNPAQFLRSAPE